MYEKILLEWIRRDSRRPRHRSSRGSPPSTAPTCGSGPSRIRGLSRPFARSRKAGRTVWCERRQLAELRQAGRRTVADELAAAAHAVGAELIVPAPAACLANEAELVLFRTYCERYRGHEWARVALLPQVYLHYDPFTRIERRTLGKAEPLRRERIDFCC